jgi:hypothetical protein
MDANPSATRARLPRPASGRERPVTRARDLAKRGVAADAASEHSRKAPDSQRPDVGERLIHDLAGDHEHGPLQLVERSRERGPIAHAGVAAQVSRPHLPFMPEHVQDRASGPAEPVRLVGAAHAPDGVKLREQPGRDERRSTAHELRIVDVAAPEELVLQRPAERRFRILLHVAGHHRVAPAAHRDVQGWTRSPGVGQAGGESDLVDESLGLDRRRDLLRRLTPPARVAVVLDLRRDRVTRTHAPFDAIASATLRRSGEGLRSGSRDTGW